MAKRVYFLVVCISTEKIGKRDHWFDGKYVLGMFFPPETPYKCLGAVHKVRHLLRGEGGVCQKVTLVYKPI